MAAPAPKRGVDPTTLLGLVKNTAPFLFQQRAPLTPYTETILRYADAPPEKLSHLDYFALCLAAHYTTVATFVPTDVDNQIRKHLWEQDAAITEKMAELVLESYAWDFRPVTARYAENEKGYVSGHQGEWFSVAVGAYGAHRTSRPELAKAVQDQIMRELRQEAAIYASCRQKKDGINLLRACTMIAHNLGDLDRVIDQWDLPKDDSLRKAAYKLGHETNASFGPEQKMLLEAGALNKALMASENHRHYPLRDPKCLRQKIDFLLPIGPFFDAWGERIGADRDLRTEDKREVLRALLEGFERLSSPKVPLYGYARAIAGVIRGMPGGLRALDLPTKVEKSLRLNPLPQITDVPPATFEAQWAKKALNFVNAS